MMDIEEIRAMSDEKIIDAIEDNKEEMWVLRRNNESGELKDTNLFQQSRRTLARLKTVQRERELAAEALAEENNDG
jgi:large subunit ribosomal protein L29